MYGQVRIDGGENEIRHFQAVIGPKFNISFMLTVH